MGMAIKKGAQIYASVIISVVHRLAWHTSWHRWEINHQVLILEVSTGNIRECYESYISPSLTKSVVKPFRAFFLFIKSTHNAKLGFIMIFGMFFPCFMREVVAAP